MQPDTPEPPVWLTIAQAAAHLQVSVRYLRDSSCPRVHHGRRVTFHRPTIDQWALARATHTVGGVAA